MAVDKGFSRRKFFRYGAGVVLGGGLVASTGQFFAILWKYLYPKRGGEEFYFVAPVSRLSRGQSLEYTAPGGQSVIISRVRNSGVVEDFIALSNICPHLGCKVYWQGQTKSFFCPCHNGRFDSMGRPTEGPPAKAGQRLVSFPLKIEKGLLYIKAMGG